MTHNYQGTPAYEAGRLAKLQGQALSANPHSRFCWQTAPEHYAWYWGWTDSAADRQLSFTFGEPA